MKHYSTDKKALVRLRVSDVLWHYYYINNSRVCIYTYLKAYLKFVKLNII